MNVLGINKDWMETIKYLYVKIGKLCVSFYNHTFSYKIPSFLQAFQNIETNIKAP